MHSMIDFVQYVIAYDLWFYAVHRVLHIPCVYAKYHCQHHRHTHPHYYHTFSAHVVENSVSGLGLFLPLVWGCSWGALAIAWVFCFARGVARHDARCAMLVGTHHLRHHTLPGKNFSSYYIDWVFGTAAARLAAASS